MPTRQKTWWYHITPNRVTPKPMTSILAAVEAALTRTNPTHKVPFHQLVLYLLDPTSEYVVRIETFAGVRMATLTNHTPDHTIRHVQCAYRVYQLVAHLTSMHIRIPPTLKQLLIDELYNLKYNIPPDSFWQWVAEDQWTAEECQSFCLNGVDGPTDFGDTFAVQLHAKDTSDSHILFSGTSLGDLGLAVKTPLTLGVTIRQDRANVDAARHSQADPLVISTFMSRVHVRNITWYMGMVTDRIIARELGGLVAASFHRLSDELQHDNEIALRYVQHSGGILKHMSDELRGDYDIVMVAVQQNGWALEYASEDLRNESEIIIAAVQEDGRALEYASEELRNDREIVLAAVQEDGWALEYASEELINDREIVLAAVQSDGSALEYASEELRNDREVVLAAVQEYGSALKYASEELRNDHEVVLAAVQEDGRALEYASEELRNDREVVLAAVQSGGSALEYASEELRNDREVVRAATRSEQKCIEGDIVVVCT